MTPRQYQREGTDWLALRKRCILADEQGLGKTLQVVNALGSGSQAAVVCPPNVGMHWVAHLSQRFAEGTVLYPNKTAANRGRKVLPEGWRAITPQEFEYAVLPLVVLYPQITKAAVVNFLHDKPPHTLIVDEVHRIKNKDSQTHKNIKKIAARVERVWGMTGTPITIEAAELPCLLWGIGVLRTRRDYYAHLREHFHVLTTRWNSVEYKPNDLRAYARSLTRDFYGMDAGVMLRRKKSQVLKELPPKLFRDIFVETDQRIVESECVRYLREHPDTPVHQGVLSEIERRVVGTQKADKLQEIIEDMSRWGKPGPTVFWAHHRDVLDAAEGEFSRMIPKGITARLDGTIPSGDRQEMVAEFQDGKGHALFCSIRAIGEGVTLTRARTAIFLQRDWNPAMNLQAEDRLHRYTQDNPVTIVRVWSSTCPLEARIQRVLATRARVSHTILEEMRRQREAELLALGNKKQLRMAA